MGLQKEREAMLRNVQHLKKSGKRKRLQKAFQNIQGNADLKGFGERRVRFVPTKNASKITIMTELHAFPLYYLDEIERPRGTREMYQKLFINTKQEGSLRPAMGPHNIRP